MLWDILLIAEKMSPAYMQLKKRLLKSV